MNGTPIYRFEPACENRINSLREKKLWISNPANFNDPFDTRANINEDFVSNEHDPEAIRIAAKTIFEGNPSHWLYNGEIVEDIRAWSQSQSIDLKSIIPKLQEHLATFGIQCFSRSHQIPLSWSHYAQAHKGFCVEYSLSKMDLVTSNKSLFSFHDVTYISQLEDILLSDILFSPRSVIERYLSTKHSDWSYEQELRLIKDNTFTSDELSEKVFGKNVDMPNGLKVTGVIAGLNMSSALKESLRCTAEYLYIPMYCMKTNNRNKYSIDKTIYWDPNNGFA
ncbi:DUF2971 domain-containing protein [Marinomonas rhizomae]|uniref:DUF2971 family protein n=1 Tax=Marinomonas rhizomae TaxID=491948 RepID=A0A366J2M1_9GAMM|nr:DUF2971 domain-containing protein [Marinomonas rhizomae]RBP81117.1 DUF2971 family protein [Marinomonas rhizomae]RNF72275.1 DUF2971 domain-containing protein [Marinomonas rhizomae]